MTKSKYEWIPCSKRLPEVDKNNDIFSDWVLVTVYSGHNNQYVCCAYYCFNKHKWYTESRVAGKVIAWTPLPEPYKDVNDN